MINRIKNYSSSATHIAPLAMFRVIFGGMMFASVMRFWLNGWIETQYILPKLFFPFYGFEWIKPLGVTGMYIVFALMAIAAVFVMLGLFYRFSAITFFLLFTYVELIDKSNYLNHYYFVSIVSLLLILVPANRYFSLDVLRKPSLLVTQIPSWMVDIFKLQLGIVYFYAGIAKLNYDWLSRAMPLAIWLPAKSNLPLVGELLNYKFTAYLFSWFGAVYDILIPFFLFNTRTRSVAYIFVIVFHAATAIILPVIGMFPYIMILATLIFFSPEFHKKLIHGFVEFFSFGKRNLLNHREDISFSFSQPLAGKVLISVLCLHFAVQVILPFRYLAYPGNLFWTEQGYRFSWRVMLMEKGGTAFFYVKDSATGKESEVDNSAYLTYQQQKMMATQPDMILQFAHFLANDFEKMCYVNPQVRAESYVTLNGSGSKPFINSSVDLTNEKEGFVSKNWILPFEETKLNYAEMMAKFQMPLSHQATKKHKVSFVKLCAFVPLWQKNFFFFFLSFFLANAQPSKLPDIEPDAAGSVFGIITDKKTGEPVFFVEVLSDNSSRSVRTDEKGKYHLRHLSYGSHKLIYFAYGYEKVEQYIDIKDEKLEINIALQPLVMDLKDVVVREEKDNDFGITRLKPVDGIAIYAGKKSEVVLLDDVAANLATNNSRQVFAKVAGLNIWESDGAGLQIGIGGRGLSPNRTSNFNTRQNGYDISADALGYPESYYSPPTEALEKIEVVRGAASLQYGTQFGGFINFVFKKPNPTKAFEAVLRQTVGSFGLFNSFNSISGTKGKMAYYTYYQFKRGDGWRPNSGFNNHAAHASVAFHATKKLSFTLEHTYMHYLAQQPGGLTDAAFANDPRQSIRERNWFRVNWNLTALMVDYKFNDKLKLNSRFFGLIADRAALGFLGLISRADPMEERDLLWDNYRNFGNETRIMYGYNLLGNHSTFLAGVRYYQGHTYRRQGFGNDGSEADFYYEHPDSLEFSEYTFPSRNVAVFAENIFAITSKFSVTPGVRYEYITTACDGYFNLEYEDLAGNVIYREHNIDKRKNNRSFVLLGIGASYKPADNLEFYGNFSQNYRAITFSDMRIINPNFRVDPNLQDEKGYSTDLGVRGNVNRMLNFDVSLFMISYNNRIGADLRLDSNTYVVYRYRTNIADSRNMGIEVFAELDLLKLFTSGKSKSMLSIFTNCSFVNARYYNSSEAAFNDKRVELVPTFTNKSGITFKRKNFQATYQFSYTGKQFSDATNAEYSANGVYGTIPAYYVMDLSLNYTWKMLNFSGGLNNITNNKYYTRRAESYPGPGIIPSDGRSFYITVGVRL